MSLVAVLALAGAAGSDVNPDAADSVTDAAVEITASVRQPGRTAELSRAAARSRPDPKAVRVRDQRAQAQRDQLRRERLRAQRQDRRAESREQRQEAARPTPPAAPSDPRQIAVAMLPAYGWDSSQFSCLDALWVSESDWNPYAENPTSGAYGIPQSLPPEKMASAGADWRTNPATQISWGLNYIRLSYGTPCSAWAFKQANNWY